MDCLSLSSNMTPQRLLQKRHPVGELEPGQRAEGFRRVVPVALLELGAEWVFDNILIVHYPLSNHASTIQRPAGLALRSRSCSLSE